MVVASPLSKPLTNGLSLTRGGALRTRGKVNRAEFKRWKAQILALQKTVKVIEAYVREIQRRLTIRA